MGVCVWGLLVGRDDRSRGGERERERERVGEGRWLVPTFPWRNVPDSPDARRLNVLNVTFKKEDKLVVQSESEIPFEGFQLQKERRDLMSFKALH